MCTLLLAYKVHKRYPLVLAANRDEFYDRPTASAACWADAPQLFAGRDLAQGGTWLGVTGTGRIAALTNYREPHPANGHERSRGELVSEFLKGEAGAEEYLAGLSATGGLYGGYNLVVGDPDGLWYQSNRCEGIVPLAAGIHGVSNHLLDTPWPKVVRGKEALARVLRGDDFTPEELFTMLADETRTPDELLPDTGVGLELERLLSSIFIKSERYGTRSSTVLLVDGERRATFVERSFDGGAVRESRACFYWRR